jgi:hemoglobin
VNDDSAPSIYAQVGGFPTFQRLADYFYDQVDADPILRPLFVDETLDGPKERLALFLAQFFGGPPNYSLQRGHPMLRARHLPFPIGKKERDAWVGHMLASIDATGISEPARSEMREYFERAATFLMNQ